MELEIDEAGRARKWIGAGVAILLLVAGAGSAAWLLATNGGSAPTLQPEDAGPILHPHVTAKIEVGYMPGSMAEAAGSVWAAVFNRTPRPYQGQLVRVDPVTNRVTGRIPLVSPPEAIAGGAGAVWADGPPWPFRILRIESASKQVTERIYGAAGLVTFGAGSVWALGHETAQESVVRIDADTNRIVATISLPKDVTDMTFGDGRLWVLRSHYSARRNNGAVLEIDPRTNTIARRIPVQIGGPLDMGGRGRRLDARAVGGTSPRGANGAPVESRLVRKLPAVRVRGGWRLVPR